MGSAGYENSVCKFFRSEEHPDTVTFWIKYLLRMATLILEPTRVTQNTGASQVAWSLTSAPQGREDYNRCGTVRALKTVSGISDTETTGELLWAGYSTTATGTLTAIQIRVYASKQSRIADHTIKLTVDGTATGSNLARADSGNDYLYSAVIPNGITLNTINRLGVLTQYRNGAVPHCDHCYVDTVWLKLTYTP